MIRILVLMSSFNGEKYISEQLDSVFNQTEVDVTLLIRDDGSTDKTTRIIKNYPTQGRIHLIEGENFKSAKSFMELMRVANCIYDGFDYFAFCDQDDIWKPNKLIEAVRALSTAPNTIPCLYLGSYQMVDSNLNRIETPTRNPKLNLPAAIVSNIATGCTMVFNKTLLSLIASKTPEDNILMHDYWTYLVCLCYNGFVFYDRTPYLLYRQHENNVIGGRGDSFFKRWLVRIIKLFRPGDFYKSRLASCLLRYYGDEISEENKAFLSDVSTCYKWSSKWHLLRNPLFRGESIDKNLQAFGLVLSGKF